MAVLNFVYAGRVYLDDTKATVAGYWGISLALNCHLVYTPDQLNARTIAEFEKADHELDYIVNKPTSQLYRIPCTDFTDLIFSQKGVFSVISNITTIPYLNIKALKPDYKYRYSSGFGVSDMVKTLSGISILHTGSSTGIFEPATYREGSKSLEIIRAYNSGSRKRFITQYINKPISQVLTPYGITSISICADVEQLVLPETVEFIELEGNAKVENLIVSTQYFTQNLLKIGSRSSEKSIQNLQAPNTDVLILDGIKTPRNVVCNGEIICRLLDDGYPLSISNDNTVHSRLSYQHAKMKGIVV